MKKTLVIISLLAGAGALAETQALNCTDGKVSVVRGGLGEHEEFTIEGYSIKLFETKSGFRAELTLRQPGHAAEPTLTYAVHQDPNLFNSAIYKYDFPYFADQESLVFSNFTPEIINYPGYGPYPPSQEIRYLPQNVGEFVLTIDKSFNLKPIPTTILAGGGPVQPSDLPAIQKARAQINDHIGDAYFSYYPAEGHRYSGTIKCKGSLLIK